MWFARCARATGWAVWVSGGLLLGAHRRTMVIAATKTTGSADYPDRYASGAEQA
jgi:hypothetical protein